MNLSVAVPHQPFRAWSRRWTFRQLPGVVALTVGRQERWTDLVIQDNRIEWFRAQTAADAMAIPTADPWRQVGKVVDNPKPSLADRLERHRVETLNRDIYGSLATNPVACGLACRTEWIVPGALWCLDHLRPWEAGSTASDATLRIRLYKCSSEYGRQHPEECEQVGDDFYYVTAPLAEAIQWYRRRVPVKNLAQDSLGVIRPVDPMKPWSAGPITVRLVDSDYVEPAP